MRRLMIILAVAVITTVTFVPTFESSEASKYVEDQPAILCYIINGEKKMTWVYPNAPIGQENVPPLPDGCVCWTRNDTREVVTADTVFAPGTYMLQAYSWVPEPWPDNSGDGNVRLIAGLIGIALIIAGAVGLGYYLYRKKH